MKRVGAVFAVVLLMAHLSPVRGQTEFPESLKQVVPEYPGATVTLCIMAEEGAKVHLDVDAEPGAVVDFYRRAMVDRGWKVEWDMVHAEAGVVILKKGGSSLHVAADSTPGGKTRLLLILAKE